MKPALNNVQPVGFDAVNKPVFIRNPARPKT